MPLSNRSRAQEIPLGDAFRRAGWKVRRPSRALQAGWDLSVSRDDVAYVVVVKQATEGRRDRMLPLLAEAILRAQAAAADDPGSRPLAVVASPFVRPKLADELLQFAVRHAPLVAAGVVDAHGLLAFVGAGLERLNARPKPRARKPAGVEKSGDLFSDVNQWMLKILLAPEIDEPYLAAPRGACHSASDLARAAEVSLISASRLVRQLEKEKFLDPEVRPLQLVWMPELLRRWRAAAMRPHREWPLRFALRVEPGRELARVAELMRWLSMREARGGRTQRGPQPARACLGLFAAADALGVGHVRGVSPHVYVERLEDLDLEELGLVRVAEGQQAEVILREARARRSIFNGAVSRGGVCVVDALQVWLDLVDHSSRGAAQAREIERSALRALFGQHR